jgi:putative ABC transport system substrate-binding protein
MSGNHHSLTKTRTRSIILVWLAAILSMLLAACGGTPQAKTYTIGVAIETDRMNPILDGFKARMVELGYVEGQNVTYIDPGALGAEPQKSETEIKRLIEQKVDLLFTLGTRPTTTAKKLTEGTDLPVVFVPIVNPVEEGIVASLSHPGGNLTGVQSVNITPKAFEWLLKIAPGTKQIYAPYNPTDQIAQVSIKPLPDAAAKLGVTLMLDEISSNDEELAAIKALPKDSAIFFIPSPSLNSGVGDMKKLAIELGIPTGSRNPETTDLVVSYTTDAASQGKQVAELVNKILKGTKPADLPVETAESILIVNLKTAKSIGLDIPDAILKQAAEVVR